MLGAAAVLLVALSVAYPTRVPPLVANVLTLRLLGGTRETSTPSSRIAPSLGLSNPAIMRKVVVFPQPDGPSMEKNSPAAMEKSASATAT